MTISAALSILYRFRAPVLAGALVLSGWLYGCQVRRNAELRGELRAQSAALDSVIRVHTATVAHVDSEAEPVTHHAAKASEQYHALRLDGPHVESLSPATPVTVPAIVIQTADAAVAAADSARAAAELRVAARDELIATLRARVDLNARIAAAARSSAREGHTKAFVIGAVVGAGAALWLSH